MAVAVVNPAYLAAYCSVPESTLSNLIDNPTSELVKSFLESVTIKAQDHDRLVSEQLRRDVELENAVHGGESRARALKSKVDQAHAEAASLKIKLSEEEKARQNMEARLQALQSTSLNSSTATQELESQVKKLESSNRDTLALLNSKSDAHDKLAEDLATQQQKLQNLRRDVTSLQDVNRTLENTLGSSQFRQQALQQELDLLKRSNEWFEAELKTKASEHSAYRREKSARVAELQRLYDESISDIESLRRNEVNLRKRLEDLGGKAETALSKIQQVQEDAARNEESFRAELDNSRRLAELHSQSAETARRRVQELENLLEETKIDATEEIANVQAELETERQARDAAERKVEQLELQLEKAEANASLQQAGSGPETPRGNARLGARGAGRPGSPTLETPNSVRSRGGLSFTQLYSEYNDIKTELEAERRRNQTLDATINDMVRSLETKEPELQELQLEHARLGAEVAELSSLLEQSGEERDAAKRDGRKAQGQVQGLLTESGLLRQQLRDLNAQIKMLLVEIQIRDQGEELSASERLHLEQVARGEADVLAMDGLSDTGRFISQRLVTFKNIMELQSTNEKLLRLTRQLGEQMEGEEARAKQDQQAKERAELESLRETVVQYQDELKSLTTQSNSYIRERDMFRRMLSHRGQLPPESEFESTFGQSVNSMATPRTPKIGMTTVDALQSPDSRDISSYSVLLKEMQSHFDSYRQETSVDLGTLKSQVDKLAKEKAELHGVMARTESQLTLAHERFDMLQANYNLLKSEREEIQKRSQSLSENAAKQDLRTQQVAEELIDARALADSARNEISNLKAEKELWKRIESRLTEDNQSLVEDRARLNKVLLDTQNLYNERSLSDSDLRRKLETQIESIEGELRVAKRKIDEESEENKNGRMRREFEQTQSRTRIDDLMKSLGNIKEELAATKTARDQLSSRVEEMKIELRNAEERAEAFQMRSSQQFHAHDLSNEDSAEAAGADREQTLALELADLRKTYELTKSELENVREQVEQYKAISQSSEEELHSLNESHDLYKQEMDKSLMEKDAKIHELEQRVDDISNEMAATESELSELRTRAEDSASRLDLQRTSFETELLRMQDERDKYMEASKFHQQDLRAQAEIAQQAQRSYDYELVKHAEATQALTTVREDYNQLRSEIANLKADAEAARMSLAQSEESWNTTRDQYEKEMAELKIRRDDINAQNGLLHQQLEAVSNQISDLQRSRDSGGEYTETAMSEDRGIHNMQEVIKYLRREKEIVDIQYELSIQESKRYKQQLDYSQSQLDEVRLKLDQERHQHVENQQNSTSHAKLLDTINELNVFRESSVALRNEARQAQTQLAIKSKEVEELLSRVQPLEAQVRELENQRDNLEGGLKLAQEDRDHWQQRTKNVLQKYDRIDPEELEGLKAQITSLQKERDDSFAEQAKLQERIDAIPSEIQKALDELKKTHQEGREKLVDQFKARSRELSTKINEGRQENTKLTERIRAMEEETELLKSQLESAKSARNENLADTSGSLLLQQQAHPATGNNDEEGQVLDSGVSATAELEKRLADTEAQFREEAAKSSQLRNEAEKAQRHADEIQDHLTRANNDLQELRALQGQTHQADDSTDTRKLKEELAEAQKEIEKLSSTNAPITTVIPNPASDEVEKQIEAIRSELEATFADKSKQLEARFQARTNNMKEQLQNKLVQRRTQIQEEMAKEKEEALQNMQKAHDESISKLEAKYRSEIEGLQKAATAIKEQVSKPPDIVSQSSAPPASENSFNEDSTVKVKAESSPLDFEWTEPQIKELIDKNQVVRGIVSRNITARVKREIDAFTAKSKEEYEKETAAKIQELQQAAEKGREQAVNLEGKKWTVKISMAENKARIAVAKVEIFQKAAAETPERPVSEVWAIANVVKGTTQPLPVAAASPTPTRTQNQPGQAQIISAKPTESATHSNNAAQLPAASATGQSAEISQDASIVQPSSTEQATQATEPPTAKQNGVLPPRPPASQQGVGTGPGALRSIIAPGSNLPRRGSAQSLTRGALASSAQTTPAAQAQQPTLAHGPSQRGGSGLPTRGGVQVRGQRGGQRGGLNAGAQQFVPGTNKRTRDEGNGNDGGGAGKRLRGGGAGNGGRGGEGTGA